MGTRLGLIIGEHSKSDRDHVESLRFPCTWAQFAVWFSAWLAAGIFQAVSCHKCAQGSRDIPQHQPRFDRPLFWGTPSYSCYVVYVWTKYSNQFWCFFMIIYYQYLAWEKCHFFFNHTDKSKIQSSPVTKLGEISLFYGQAFGYLCHIVKALTLYLCICMWKDSWSPPHSFWYYCRSSEPIKYAGCGRCV